MAWQVHGTDTLTPAEALVIYERNALHLDTAAMPAHEQALLQALRTGLGQGLGPAKRGTTQGTQSAVTPQSRQKPRKPVSSSRA